MTFNYDPLAYFGLAGIVLVIVIGAAVLINTSDNVDIEARKVRLAAATFTGILMLFIFVSILYFIDASPQGAGKDIFDKSITAMSPILGAIIGYVFSSRQKPKKRTRPPTPIKPDPNQGPTPD